MLFSKLIAKLYLKQPNNLAYFDQACGCYNRNRETKGQFKADTLVHELQSQYSISISYGTVQLKRNESLQSAVDRADKEMYAMKRMYYTTKVKQL